MTFAVLLSVCGRDALYWDRAELAVGRPAIVGRTVKRPEQLPGHGLADAQPP